MSCHVSGPHTAKAHSGNEDTVQETRKAHQCCDAPPQTPLVLHPQLLWFSFNGQGAQGIYRQREVQVEKQGADSGQNLEMQEVDHLWPLQATPPLAASLTSYLLKMHSLLHIATAANSFRELQTELKMRPNRDLLFKKLRPLKLKVPTQNFQFSQILQNHVHIKVQNAFNAFISQNEENGYLYSHRRSSAGVQNS